MIEAEAIPYEPASLRGERLLVLAPHPDDEVIGCGGLIALQLREGRAVHVVIVTDGGEAGDASVREEEARRGLALLADQTSASVAFLKVRDRHVDDSVAAALREQLVQFRPDLIAVPSPIEIHPDHAAVARAFLGLVQRDETLHAELAVARVAFFEVSHPIRPNALLDISDVAEKKWAAIAEHASQTGLRDYTSFARGLNAYRTMTLPEGTAFAEAYRVYALPSLRTASIGALSAELGGSVIEVQENAAPVSVIIRTKDRPALLREAVESVRANRYPCEIVVVNDGGARPELEDVTLVEHETSRGRSEAMNSGVRAAKHALIAFLDDDDLYEPEHLAMLTRAARKSTSHVAWYSDAVSAFLKPGANGGYETESRLRLYGRDFDRDLLLLDNYIPLPTVLVARETYLAAGGFDPAFDLFEDWDFLIRVMQRGAFLHVPRITVTVRHFAGGTSIVLGAPSGSPRFVEAKSQIWRKHAALFDHKTIADAFESQKQRVSQLYSEGVESRGLASQLQNDVVRAERDARAQSKGLQSMLDEASARIHEFEGANQALQGRIEALIAERDGLLLEVEHLTREGHNFRDAIRKSNDDLQAAWVEIHRLNGLLDLIYQSRTWKLHTTLEKLRGRG